MEMRKDSYWLNKSGVQSLSLAVLATIGVAFSLSLTKNIMIPFVLSLFLYFMLLPLRAFFIKRLKFPKFLALFSTFAVVVILLMVIISILISAIQEFATGYTVYEAKAIYFADSIQDWLLAKGLPLQDVSLSKLMARLPVGQLVRGAGAGVLNLVSTSILVFIFLIFLFTGTIKKASDSEEEEVSKSGVGRKINRQIQKYLSIKLLTSATTGLLTFLILSILGLDLAFVLGFMAFVLNFIPTIGSLVSVLLPLPVAFFQYDSVAPILMVLVIPGSVQFFIGNVIEPRLMGRSLNIHPVTVLMSLMFWSLIWGVVGAFLAVPITAILKIVVEKIEGGQVISKIMSGSIEEPTSSEV